MQVRDFAMFAGDSKTLSVSVTEQADNSATNITGATISWKVSRSLRTTPVISKSTSDGITITSGSGGTFDISLDPSDTEDLDGDYMHEAQITFTTGEVSTVLKGVMTVERGLN